MTSVKVVGAGSIGNHLAHGCRSKGWEVTIVDLNPEALERTRNTIYPSRYGTWDEGITLATPSDLTGQSFDVVIIGTPPSTHLPVAATELINARPKLLLIEKPLADPNAEAINAFVELADQLPTRVLVGYNHRLKPNTLKFLEVASDSSLGKLTGLSSHMLESWDGILRAHFWIESETDSYLAFTDQGGGALFEHSHALNLLLHFATQLDQGNAVEVNATVEWVHHESGRYDRDTHLSVTLDSGIVAEVRQDLHTWPAQKEAFAKFEKGTVVWKMGDSSDSVTILDADGCRKNQWDFPKVRPDDFLGEISHLAELLENPRQASPIDLDSGLRVMEVALAAMKSSTTGAPALVRPLGVFRSASG